MPLAAQLIGSLIVNLNNRVLNTNLVETDFRCPARRTIIGRRKHSHLNHHIPSLAAHAEGSAPGVNNDVFHTKPVYL